MDMNPFHMQLLLQYMYRGEISVPQGELAPLMTSARSLQIKGLCNSTSPPGMPVPPQQPETDRLSEFANYLAANTQPQPLTSIMPPGKFWGHLLISAKFIEHFILSAESNERRILVSKEGI